ncbi:myb-like protein Q [Musca domestica]|uniref:Myb-like protein Q n=1 Tax=Musca domestica TaxID=7370 RepID=A0ABM3UYG7_MUSDO|nr:myb-like protein Q [Musca domestica]
MESGKFVCKLCSKKSASPSAYKKHLETHEMCNICEKFLLHSAALKLHYAVEHSEQGTKPQQKERNFWEYEEQQNQFRNEMSIWVQHHLNNNSPMSNEQDIPQEYNNQDHNQSGRSTQNQNINHHQQNHHHYQHQQHFEHQQQQQWNQPQQQQWNQQQHQQQWNQPQLLSSQLSSGGNHLKIYNTCFYYTPNLRLFEGHKENCSGVITHFPKDVYTTKLYKVVLNYKDSKRKVRLDKVNTYAWGHYGIEDEDDLSNMLQNYESEMDIDTNFI